MHTSLDGFVAGPAGEMDWIHVDDAMFEFTATLTDQADTAMYGRVTWEMMGDYWPTAGLQAGASAHDIHHSAWYNRVEKVVVSRSMKGMEVPNTRIIGDQLREQVNELKAEPGNSILIFGSPSTCHALMENDLIDEYWLFINPLVLGDGIPLFIPQERRIDLYLAESREFNAGVIRLHYVKK